MTAPDDNPPPGWNDHWARLWAAEDRGALIPCRVVRIDKGGITVSSHPGDERLVVAAKTAALFAECVAR